MLKHVDLLDCTLRDGSYALNHQFTVADTARICAALEGAGLRMIEVGHGVGLGASGPRHGFAAETDEAYLRAAAGALKQAKYGAFFIPGIGTMAHLDMARQCGMGFVRVGTNITQYKDAKDYIIHAKNLGFEVSYNAMKSYVVTPRDFLTCVRDTVAWGADAVFLVDSAGGMLPGEVSQYIRLMRDNLEVQVGFHGHNNLMMASANNLAALAEGATVLDTTLQGIGRGSGNAPTEVMTALCEKMGYHTGIDLWKTLEAGEKLVRPLMNGGGITSLEVAIGLACFHSSYLDRIYRVTQRIPVDPKLLIIEVSKIDKVNPSEELMERVAMSIVEKGEEAENGIAQGFR